MKVLLQRVLRASVRVEGRSVASIRHGILAFVAIEQGDGDREIDYMADKTTEIRIFEDRERRMNASVADAGGAVLAVSQFTLAAQTRRGRRPSFGRAAAPAVAEPLFRRYVERVRSRGISVEQGVFRAMMEVELVNDGPVTISLDPPPWMTPRD